MEDYVSTVSYTELFNLKEDYLKDINGQMVEVKIECIFNGTSWIVFNTNDNQFVDALETVCEYVLYDRTAYNTLALDNFTDFTVIYQRYNDVTTNDYSIVREDVIISETRFTSGAWKFNYKIWGKTCRLYASFEVDVNSDRPSSPNNDHYFYGMILDKLPSNLLPKNKLVGGTGVMAAQTGGTGPINNYRGTLSVFIDEEGFIYIGSPRYGNPATNGYVSGGSNVVHMYPSYGFTGTIYISFNFIYEIN